MVDFTESDIDSVDDGTGTSVPPAGRDEQEKQTAALGNFGSGRDGTATDDTTGSTLPTGSVPEGVTVTLQALHGNASRIKVGLTTSPTIELAAGQSAEYRVKDTDQIHVEAKTAGDGVAFSHEVSV